MDKRAVFNRVKNHLLTQNKRSVRASRTNNGRCVYRGDDGCMCAIGCLIDDKHYSPKLEGETTVCTPVMNALRNSGVAIDSDEMINMLGALQLLHDIIMPEHWLGQLIAMEQKWFGTDLAGA